jgi:hypothetical protein
MLRPSAASLLLILAAPAPAQSGLASRPPAAVEAFAGYAGFVDESLIEHAVLGTSARIYLTPRIALGPELAYMRGPGADRDLFLTGNLTFDLLSPRQGRPRRVSPFLVAGGGFMRHSDSFGAGTFSSSEGAVTGGGGVRVRLNDRAYAVADFRVGWEPHVRVTGGIGVSLGR